MRNHRRPATVGTGALQPEYVFHVFQMTLKRARIRIPQHSPGDALTLLQTHTTEHRSRHAAVRRRTPTANGTATRRTDTKPASDTNREHQDTPVHSFAAHSTGMRCAVYAHALLPESYHRPITTDCMIWVFGVCVLAGSCLEVCVCPFQERSQSCTNN